jgi:hypothetical protein
VNSCHQLSIFRFFNPSLKNHPQYHADDGDNWTKISSISIKMKKCIFPVIIALLFCVIVCAQSPNASKPEELSDHINSLRIVEELQRCPPWITFRANETEFRSGITRLYFGITVYNTPTIRAAIQYLLSEYKEGSNSDDRFYADAKVFALLRVIFKVPPGFGDVGNQFGSWGSPVQAGRVNLLWPYDIDSNGKLVLVGTGGRYFGPPYDALAEFDEFASLFPRRDVQPNTHSRSERRANR